MATWMVDLSWPVRPGLGDLPGHPPTEVREFHRHETHGRSNALLSVSIHSSTHLDVPYHFYQAGLTVDQLPPERLCCPGVLLGVKGEVDAGRPIQWEHLARKLASIAAVGNLAGRAVLIRTGWAEERYSGHGYYGGNPYLSTEAAQRLVAERVNMVGLDFPPDAIGEKMVVPAPAPVHETLLGGGVCILENLANLSALPETVFELLCLPIKLQGQGGAPARVLARSTPSGYSAPRST